MSGNRNPVVQRKNDLPLLARVTMICLLVPMIFHIGSLLLTPSRLLLLVVTPILMLRLLSGAYGRILAADVFLLGFVIWRTIALAVTMPEQVVQYSGSNTVIAFGAYLVARATIRSPDSFRAMALFFTRTVLVLLPLALVESLSGDFIIPKILNALPGVDSVKDVNYERRLGLDRAQVVFDHPILFGLYASLAISLSLIALRQRFGTVWRLIRTGLILACVFFSVSSGAFLAALVQIALSAYGRIFAWFRGRWVALCSVVFSLYVLAEILSSRPALFVLLEKMAFDSWTANYRRLIFQYGTEQVQAAPLFGVGIGAWAHPSWMTNSIDNYWLGMAIQFGLPALACIAMAFLAAMVAILRAPLAPGSEAADHRLAWMLTFLSMTLTLATVYIWSDAASAVYFIFGSGLWIATWQEQPAKVAPPVADLRVGPRYSRFPLAEVA